MARTYNGTSDKLVVSMGNLAFAPATTGVSMAAIIKRNSTAWNSVMAARDNSGAVNGFSMEIETNASGNNLTFDGGSSGGGFDTSSFTVTNADGWVLVAVTRPATATATARFHKYVYSSGSLTQQAGTSANLTNPTWGAAPSFEVGGPWGTSTDWFGGDIACAAVWNRQLSDAEVANLPFTLQAWLSASPTALWVLDQSATGQKVIDLSGGGANESTLTGTSVSTNSVPVFNYTDGVWLPTFPAAASGNASVTHVVGNIDLSGAAPSLSAGSAVTHVVGNVALGASAPVIGGGAGVTHVIGNIDLGAVAPTAGASSSVTHVIGNIALGGAPPVVSGSGSAMVSHVIGNIDLSAVAPSLTSTSTVAHIVGNLALTGGSNTVSNGAVSILLVPTSPAPAILYLMNEGGPLA